MKLTTLLFVVSLFTIKASTYSQNTKISLALENVSIEEVFSEIESLTDFKFFYNHRKIDVSKKVSVSVVEERISSILNELFLDSNIYFKVRKKQIIVKTGRTPASAVSSAPKEEKLQDQIRGTVTDNSGSPLPGVNVVVQGTSTGTQTDFDGNYVISASLGDVLVFSYIGFSTQNITVGDDTSIDVSMQEDTAQLDEVVVVGYGTTTKRKLTSSVTSINVEDELQEIPATNLSNAVAGRFSGVNVLQATGKPGQSSNIQIRGATNGFFGGAPVLYVIDNIIATKELFDALDVNEVADVSILKDAAATAAYGSRGANGVVLVTTRKGRTGKPSINITSTIGSTEPTQTLDFTTPYEHALFINQTRTFDAGGNPAPEDLISQTELDYLRGNNFGSFVDQLAKDPLLIRNAVNISGGTERISYFLAGSHIKETGAFDNLTYEKTNFRANVEAEVAKGLKIGLNLSSNNDVADEFYWRWNGGNETFADFYRTANRQGRWAPAVIDGLPVANFNGWNAANIIDKGQGFNLRKTRNQSALLNLTYDIPFVDGLSVGATYNRTNTSFNQHLVRTSLIDHTFATDPNNQFALTNEVLATRVRNDDGANTNSVARASSDRNTSQLNFRLGYNNTFGDHTVNATAIYEEWEGEFISLNGTRRGLVSSTLPEFSGTSPDLEDQLAGSAHNDIGRQSFIGLAGWSYQDKYFLNGSFRADASVHFAEGNRWGYFPAISAGWVVSEEDFFNKNVNFIDYFKIKFSVGETGNDNIFGLDDLLTGSGTALFPYIQPFGFGPGAVLGNGDGLAPGTFISGQANPNTTWNTQTSTNLGVEFQFLDNKLKTSFEYYKNKRRGIFGSRQGLIPVSSGISLLPENFAGIDVKGIDIEASYADSVGDLSFDVGLLFGYTDDEYAILDEAESLRPFQRLQGQGTNRLFGYKTLGIIRTQEQLDQLITDGYSFNGQTPVLGEMYFADIRGNAVDDPEGNTPDGIVDGNDQTWIADRSVAPINYGIRLNLNYKRFRLEAFAQGFEGHYTRRPDIARFTFAAIGEGSTRDWLDSWSLDNPNASLPRFSSRNLFTNNTLFTHDAGFLRLKNLNFGYDIPDNIVNTIGAKNINVFVNTTNLFFFYRSIKTWDPEVEGQGIPVNKTYSLGLNITF